MFEKNVLKLKKLWDFAKIRTFFNFG